MANNDIKNNISQFTEQTDNISRPSIGINPNDVPSVMLTEQYKEQHPEVADKDFIPEKQKNIYTNKSTDEGRGYQSSYSMYALLKYYNKDGISSKFESAADYLITQANYIKESALSADLSSIKNDIEYHTRVKKILDRIDQHAEEALSKKNSGRFWRIAAEYKNYYPHLNYPDPKSMLDYLYRHTDKDTGLVDSKSKFIRPYEEGEIPISDSENIEDSQVVINKLLDKILGETNIDKEDSDYIELEDLVTQLLSAEDSEDVESIEQIQDAIKELVEEHKAFLMPFLTKEAVKVRKRIKDPNNLGAYKYFIEDAKDSGTGQYEHGFDDDYTEDADGNVNIPWENLGPGTDISNFNLKKLTKKIDELKARNSKLEDDLSKTSNESDISRIESLKNRTNRELAYFSTMLKKQQKWLAKIKNPNNIKLIQKAIDDLSTQKEQLVSNLISLAQKNDEVETQDDLNKEQNIQSIKKIDRVKKIISLYDKLEKLKSAIDGLPEVSDKRKKYEKRLKDFTGVLADRLDSYEEDYKEELPLNDQGHYDIESLRKVLSKMEEELPEEKSSKDEYRKEIRDIDYKLIKLNDLLDTLNEDLSVYEDQYNEYIDSKQPYGNTQKLKETYGDSDSVNPMLPRLKDNTRVYTPDIDDFAMSFIREQESKLISQLHEAKDKIVEYQQKVNEFEQNNGDGVSLYKNILDIQTSIAKDLQNNSTKEHIQHLLAEDKKFKQKYEELLRLNKLWRRFSRLAGSFEYWTVKEKEIKYVQSLPIEERVRIPEYNQTLYTQEDVKQLDVNKVKEEIRKQNEKVLEESYAYVDNYKEVIEFIDGEAKSISFKLQEDKYTVQSYFDALFIIGEQAREADIQRMKEEGLEGKNKIPGEHRENVGVELSDSIFAKTMFKDQINIQANGMQTETEVSLLMKELKSYFSNLNRRMTESKKASMQLGVRLKSHNSQLNNYLKETRVTKKMQEALKAGKSLEEQEMLQKVWDENKSNLYKPLPAQSWAEVVDEMRQSLNRVFNKLNQAYEGRTHGDNYVMTLNTKGNPVKLRDEFGNPVLKNPKDLTHTIKKTRDTGLQIDQEYVKTEPMGSIQNELKYLKDKYNSIDLSFTAEEEELIKHRMQESGKLRQDVINELFPEYQEKLQQKKQLEDELRKLHIEYGEKGYLHTMTSKQR